MKQKHSSLLKVIIVGSIIPLMFLIISLMVMNDYGETTDEKPSQISGRYYYYQWGEQKSVDEYINAFSIKDRNYGPLFDTLSVASNDLLYDRYRLIKNPVASYHVPAIIASVMAIVAVYIFAYITWGMAAGILSSLTLAVMPRFIGDSQNNLKDTPVLALFACTVTLYYLAVTRKRTIYYIMAGITLGMTYATKINALIILPVIMLWFIYYNGYSLKGALAFVKGVAASLVSAFITILICWPYYRYKPWERFAETFSVFRNHEWNDYILYMGTHYRGHDVPREYPFVMFGVTTPLFFLILLGIAVILMCFTFLYSKGKPYRSPLLLLFIWMLSTPLAQALSPNPMYDGIRHFQASLAPMAILIGCAVWSVARYLLRRKTHFVLAIYILLISACYVNILLTDIRIHPYQIVYFNEVIGGGRGAYRKFDLDYWGQSLQEATHWIHHNLPTGSRLRLTNYMEHHFPIDRTRYAMVTRYPQYRINVIRGSLHELDTDEDYLYPKRAPLHEIVVDGAPVLQIFAYPENNIATDSSLMPVSPNRTKLLRRGLIKNIYENTTFTGRPTESIVDNTMHYSCQTGGFYNNVPVSIAYDGYITIPHDGAYCFSIDADDEAIMKLDNNIILISPTLNQRNRRVSIKAGMYRFRLEYINEQSNGCLMVQWAEGDCEKYADIPESALFH